MQIIPTQRYITIAMKDRQKLSSGLVLPEGSAELQPYGRVLATGPDCKLVEPGDAILFNPSNLMAGFNHKQSDECFILPEECVFAKILVPNE